jgi:hypothetical protein
MRQRARCARTWTADCGAAGRSALVGDADQDQVAGCPGRLGWSGRQPGALTRPGSTSSSLLPQPSPSVDQVPAARPQRAQRAGRPPSRCTGEPSPRASSSPTASAGGAHLDQLRSQRHHASLQRLPGRLLAGRLGRPAWAASAPASARIGGLVACRWWHQGRPDAPGRLEVPRDGGPVPPRPLPSSEPGPPAPGWAPVTESGTPVKDRRRRDSCSMRAVGP